MQDKRTGEFIELAEDTQKARDAAIPDRARQGVILYVGETVWIKGGRFVVVSIGQRVIRLRGLPGVDVVEDHYQEPTP